ncbi:MAG: toprim domain-containing protein [Methylococcales bacterium]|nr:toprim domain-containing protein [Methylococcales bacterium]
MNAKELRNKSLVDVCELLGLEKDQADYKQWRGDGARITLNGFAWFDHDAGTGSGGAIDLVMHVLKVDYSRALEYLNGNDSNLSVINRNNSNADEHVYLKPPEPVRENFCAVADYLRHKRRIKPAVIDWLYMRGQLYADRYSNCVFMYGPGACELRGTGPVQWRSARGKFDHGFILPALCTTGVAVLESAIDAISYRQLNTSNYAISLGGNSNDTIMRSCIELARTKNVPVIAAFDNDSGGDIATAKLEALALASAVMFTLNRPKHGKDWNDSLTAK